MIMKRLTLIGLCLGATLATSAIAQQPEPPPPVGPYRDTCQSVRVKREKIVTTLYAVCAPSRKESSVPLPCVGEIINRDGQLVCRPKPR